jgi:methionine-rich copper-binding protein CopC
MKTALNELKSLFSLILIAIFITLLAGCGGDGSNEGNASVANLSSVIPKDGSVDVTKNTIFLITFNTAVSIKSLQTTATVFVQQSQENSLIGKLPSNKIIAEESINLSFQGLSNDAKQASFVLPTDHPLQSNTRYTLRVNLNLVTDIQGNSIGSDIITISSFTTGDLTNPSVAIISPQVASTTNSTSLNIKFGFNEQVLNVSTQSVILTEGSKSGTKVEINTIEDAGDNTFIIPVSNLRENTTYFISFNSNITDLKGNHLATSTFSFRTGDVTRPMASMVNPYNGAQNQSTSINIELLFSEQIVNLNTTTVQVHQTSINGPTATINSVSHGSGNTYFVTMSNLQQATTYYITLDSSITDLAGNHIQQNYPFEFTTGDFTVPTVNILQPSNGASNLSTSLNIQLQFSKTVNNVDNSSIQIYRLIYDPESGEFTPEYINITNGAIHSADGKLYTIDISGLQEMTQYYITANNQITDEFGTHLETSTFDFTTGDFTAPTISMLSPANGSTVDSFTPTIIINFSEAVQNVNLNNITLHKNSPTGDPISFTTLSSVGYTYFLTTPNLEPNTTYYLSIGHITDNYGNPLDYPTDLSFSISSVNTIWHYIGVPNFIPNYYITDMCVANNNLYIASNDSVSATTPILINQYITGSWVPISYGFAFPNSSTAPRLAINNNGILYLAYINRAQGNAVVAFDGSLPHVVGDRTFTTNAISYLSLATYNSNVFTAYSDYNKSAKLIVQKYNGSNWVSLGSNNGVSTGSIYKTSLAIGTDGTPYIAYTDDKLQKLQIKKYNGTTWIGVGSGSAPKIYASDMSIKTYSSDIYLLYINTVNRLSVMKFDGDTWSNVGSPNISTDRPPTTSNISALAVNSSGVPYIAYVKDRQIFVSKFDGSSWVNVGESPIVPLSAPSYLNLSINNASGQIYLSYITDSGSAVLEAHE